MCVLIFHQIYLNLWLTKKLIILIKSYDDRHRERKRKSRKTIHLLHTREPLCCIDRANKIKSNGSNLLAKVPRLIQSGIQTTSQQEIHQISVCLLHNTGSSETNTDNSFIGITVQYLQLRGIIWQETYWTK